MLPSVYVQGVGAVSAPMSGVGIRAGSVAASLVLMSVLASASALADGQLSALPDNGATFSYAATKSSMQGQPLSGTLTLTRVDAGSVHVVEGDGLIPTDNTLAVDSQGSGAQPSPVDPFIDLLDNLAIILAAAPADLQQSSQWNVNLSPISFLQSEGNSKKHLIAPNFKYVTVTTNVVTIAGDDLTFHADGKNQSYLQTIGGPSGASESVTIDFELQSGHLKSCTQTVTFGFGYEYSPMDVTQSASLAPKQ